MKRGKGLCGLVVAAALLWGGGSLVVWAAGAETGELHVLGDPARVYQDWPSAAGADVQLPAAERVTWPPDRQFRSVTMDEQGRGGSLFAAGDFGNAAGEVGVKLRFDGGPPRLMEPLSTVAYLGGYEAGVSSEHTLRLNVVVFDRSSRDTRENGAHRLVLQSRLEILPQVHTGGQNLAHVQVRNGNISTDIREIDLNGHVLSIHGGVMDMPIHGNISSFGGIRFAGGTLEFHDYPSADYGIWGAGFSPMRGSIQRPPATGQVREPAFFYLHGPGVLRWHTLGQMSLGPNNSNWGRTIGPVARWDSSALQIEVANNRYREGGSDWEVWSDGRRMVIGAMQVGGEYSANIRLVDHWGSTAGAGREVLAVTELHVADNGRLDANGISIVCDRLVLGGRSVRAGVYPAERMKPWIHDESGLATITVGAVEDPMPEAEAVVKVPLEREGLVSAGIFDQEGRLLRNLIFGNRRDPGALWLAWDGLDDLGNPMPPGSYEWRVLHRQPFVATLVANPGVNHPEGPARAWGGNHRGPESVTSDADGYYVAFPGSEGAGVLLNLYPDGTRWWTLSYKDDHANAAEAMDADGSGRLAILTHSDGRGLKLEVLSTKDGRLLRSQSVALDPPPARWGWIRNAHLAAHDGVAVVTYKSHNRIRTFDLATGEEQNAIEVAAPGAVTFDSEGVVWFLSDEGVYRWVVGEGVPERVWESLPLGRCTAIAWDAKAGSFLLAESGTEQILRVSPEGRELARYGRAGGREFGPWEGGNFRGVLDLTADGEGGFLVVEQPIRRTAHFDAQGRLIAEWFGGQRWGHGIGVDPEDVTLGTIEGGDSTLCLVRMDHATRTWEMLETYAEPDTLGIFPKLAHEKWNLFRRGGRLYHLFNDPKAGVALYEIDRENGKLLPRAAFVRMDLRQTLPAVWTEALAMQGLSGRPSGMSWSDLNGNGKIEPEEIQFGAYNLPWGYDLHVKEDWTLLTGDPSTRSAWVKIPNRFASNPEQAPHWDLSARQFSEAVWPERFFDVEAFGNRPSTVAIHRNEAGETWSIIRGHGSAQEDRQGEFWPEFYGGSDRVVKWNRDGEVAWVAGRHMGGRGGFTMAYGLLGSFQGNIVVRDRYGVPTSIWSEEGLYAGNLLESWTDDSLPSWVYDYFSSHSDSLIEYDQHFSGFWTYPDGSVYYGMQGRSSTPIFKVEGWDGWERLFGEIRLTEDPPAAKREGDGLKAEYFAGHGFDGEPVLVRVDPQIWFEAAPQLAGGLILETWGSGPPAEGVPADGFSVRWTGWVEPRFSEDYRFVIETDLNAKVSMWVGDEQVIFDDGTVAGRRSARIDRNFLCRRNRSRSLPLQAGERYPIRIESEHTEGQSGIHLMWESRTQERLHVPVTALYSEGTAAGRGKTED